VRPRGLHGLFDTAEGRRLKEIATGTPWRRWGPYLQSANRGPSAKTTAPTGKLGHGHSFRSSKRIVAPIVGERMASRDSATRLCVGAWAWRFGMARTRF
jgi:hypothetical protein